MPDPADPAACAYSSPGFVRRHLAALRAGLTAGLDLPADATPADHLRVAERILTERMPVLPPSVLPLLLVGLGSFVLTGKLQPDADPARREAVLRSMPHNVTTEMDLRLWTLACAIRARSGSGGRADRHRAGRPSPPATTPARWPPARSAG